MRETVLPAVERNGPIEAWIIDERRSPRKGRILWGGTPVLRSTRQRGQLSGRGVTVGCQSSCQVAGGYRLYLPEVWASDAARRKKAGVPDQIVFQTKIEVALESAQPAPWACRVASF